MNGRLYNPLLRRFLNADENIQDPTNTQNYNKYGYVMNNPLMYNDPSGEFIFTLLAVVTGQWWAIPLAIGADLGAYNGLKVGQALGVTGLKLVGYVLGGAIIGSHSAGIAMSIAAASIPFAATLSIMAGSFSNSLGMFFLSGGKTPVTVSFGGGSYNFSSNAWGYLGKKGNSFMENFGYSVGLFANLSDGFSVLKGVFNKNNKDMTGDIDLVTKNDQIGHTELITTKTGENITSVGPPDSGVPKNQLLFGKSEGQNTWHSYKDNVGDWDVTRIMIKNVRYDKLNQYNINLTTKPFEYSVMRWNGLSCVTAASEALLKAGVFNLPFFRHPSLLQFQMFIRNNPALLHNVKYY